MSYGHNKKPSCCYQCAERVVGCHATCKRHAEETQNRLAEKKAKREYLSPAFVSYFKKPERVSVNARQSKKRYR